MNNTVDTLKSGGVGVLATDTLYGLVGSALNKNSVKRIYSLKQRRPDKPFIILICEYKDLELLGVSLDGKLKKQLSQYWPGPVSIILPCPDEKFYYLHRGTKTLALRMPAKKPINDLLSQTGPLVAPSANPEGLKPARSVMEARDYFGNLVDFYMPGQTSDKASKLIKLSDNKIDILRN